MKTVKIPIRLKVTVRMVRTIIISVRPCIDNTLGSHNYSCIILTLKRFCFYCDKIGYSLPVKINYVNKFFIVFLHMRYLTIILLTLFLNIACLGNKANKNLVTEGGTLSLDLIKSKESIDSLSKELAILKNDYINLQKEVDTNQNVVLEYGSSLVGIIVGIIILFGIVYYNSSKQAARDAFNDQFDNYSSSIKNKLTEAQLALDRVKTRIDVIDEAESEIEESTNRIEHEFQ